MDDTCQCIECGRLHRRLAKPPWALSHDELCRLSRRFLATADLNINSPDYRINEWLKKLIESAALAAGERG